MFDPSQVGSIFLWLELGRVSHLWFRFGKFSPKNDKFFSLRIKKICSGRVKGRLASHLLRVKSKLGSGQGPSLDFILQVIDYSYTCPSVDFATFLSQTLFENNK